MVGYGAPDATAAPKAPSAPDAGGKDVIGDDLPTEDEKRDLVTDEVRDLLARSIEIEVLSSL